MIAPSIAFASVGTFAGPTVVGIPVEFILFATVLLGVALFHHYTFPIAAGGALLIALYKILFSPFKTGAGWSGFAAHLAHEWVILVNLLLLLLGFALLAKHFEDTRVPNALPRILPDDWKGCFMLLVIVFVLSSFLDNIAAALIGGAMAHTVFRAKVHIGYLAAIVAASNAGGAGSVIGDTTTTMMWIAGIGPLEVAEAAVGASIALVIFGIPASLQQQRYSPIQRDADAGVVIDWARVGVVAFILIAAVVVNITINTRFNELADLFPFLRCRGVGRAFARYASSPPRLAAAAGCAEGFVVPAFIGSRRIDDAGRSVTAGFVANRAGSRLFVVRVRQHSADRAGDSARRLRLGVSGVCGRFWRIDDLVWFVSRGRTREQVPGSALGRPLAASRMACGHRLRGRILRDGRHHRLASRVNAAHKRAGRALRKSNDTHP